MPLRIINCIAIQLYSCSNSAIRQSKYCRMIFQNCLQINTLFKFQNVTLFIPLHLYFCEQIIRFCSSSLRSVLYLMCLKIKCHLSFPISKAVDIFIQPCLHLEPALKQAQYKWYFPFLILKNEMYIIRPKLQYKTCKMFEIQKECFGTIK